jgi:hypothetical protein
MTTSDFSSLNGPREPKLRYWRYFEKKWSEVPLNKIFRAKPSGEIQIFFSKGQRNILKSMRYTATVYLSDRYSFKQYDGHENSILADFLGLGYRLEIAGYIKEYNTDAQWSDLFLE